MAFYTSRVGHARKTGPIVGCGQRRGLNRPTLGATSQLQRSRPGRTSDPSRERGIAEKGAQSASAGSQSLGRSR